MKPLAIILLFLCFGLAGGHNNVYAGLVASVNHISPIGFSQTKETVTPRHNHQQAVLTTEVCGQEKDDFSFAEDNEDNEHIFRKHILPIEYFARFFYTFLSNYYATSDVKTFAVAPQSPLSVCIILLHGVLRI